jgi:syntaxin-binding protein 5
MTDNVLASQTEAKIFKPAAARGASKSFDDFLCESACVTEFAGHGSAFVGVFGDRTIRAFSIPALKEIAVSKIEKLDKGRLGQSIVTPSGCVFGWTGPSELVMLNVWGTGESLPRSQDQLFNPKVMIPPRPTISNMQWISGTQYVSPIDLDLLIGGPDRPPSKRMLALAAEEDRLARSGGPSRAGTAASQEGWGDYMARQINERTERLNIIGDSTDQMLDHSQGYAEAASKFVSRQKRNMLLGGITGKFF